MIKNRIERSRSYLTGNRNGYADVVLVPLANPATASELLHLAGALIKPKTGRIIAASVSLGDTEKHAESIEELEDVIARVRAEGYTIELERVVSTSISRGILDLAREDGADLLLLGIRHAERGRVVLGQVVENVIQTAPCDVLVYRTSHSPGFDRVIIPVDNARQARLAARIALRISGHHNLPIEAMRPQPSHTSHYEGLAVIEEALEDIPGAHVIRRNVVEAAIPVDGLLHHLGEDDLIIVGFSERSELERMIFGDLPRGLLESAEGPLVLVSRSIERETTGKRLLRRAINWVRPTLTRTEQDEIVRQAGVGSRLTIDYVILILVSAAIASLGLLLNNVAVIIGAMLVAPLMQPLIGVAAGLAAGRVRIAARGLLTLTIGVVMALGMAYLIGLLLPRLPTSEMMARGRPTLLDAVVALASGIVGAYATARRDIPAALAGVAIAAALMPPLVTVGLGAAINEMGLTYGATVLFLTNTICIIVASMLLFYYLGMTFRRYDNATLRLQIAAVLLLVLAAVPLGVELVDLTQQVTTQNIVRRDVAEELPQDAELIEIEIEGNEPVRVVATVRSPRPLTPEDTRELETRIERDVGEPIELELVVLQVIRLDVEPEATVAPTPVPVITPLESEQKSEQTPEPSPVDSNNANNASNGG